MPGRKNAHDLRFANFFIPFDNFFLAPLRKSREDFFSEVFFTLQRNSIF